ncbi:MAG: DUF4861 domain-containing protein [Verrucomicrobia bacterium]|nr:DUF4861 domain-containing protein [Verrucomicrobiota bacterium]MBU1736438.1 DUF4861 domain-containing protein [Verrucomicrobiota bacterium]MBU1857190.1 DUF4861 domain-containing protein [Verrucomicrobiota bacterium]
MKTSVLLVSVTLKLTNPLSFDRAAEPVVISLDNLPELRAALTPARSAVVAHDGDKILPAQADDLDGDGIFDELVFFADLSARETRTITLIANPKLPPSTAEKKTATNPNGPGGFGWESNLIAYRTYCGRIDIFGKKKAALILHTPLDHYHREADWGMDIFYIGPSVGLGGLLLWEGKRAIPVVNEAGQPEKVKITNRVIVDGPLRSVVELKLKLQTPQGQFDLTRRLAIYADNPYMEEQLTITGGKGNEIIYSPGLIKIDKGQFGQGQDGLTYIWNWGNQNHPDTAGAEEISLALLAPSANVIGTDATEFDHILRCRTQSGVPQRQYLVAGWSKGLPQYKTAGSWSAYIAALAQRLAAPVQWTREEK